MPGGRNLAPSAPTPATTEIPAPRPAPQVAALAVSAEAREVLIHEIGAGLGTDAASEALCGADDRAGGVAADRGARGHACAHALRVGAAGAADVARNGDGG